MKRITSHLKLVESSEAALSTPDGYSIATWAGLSPRDIALFADAPGGVWRLPELSLTENETVLSKYHSMIADIGVASGRDSVWWYTWSSSRDRFHSNILADMELTARFQKACVQGLPERLVMLCRDPYLAGALLSIAGIYGVKTHTAIGARLRWIQRRFRMKLRPLNGSIRTCGRIFLIKRRIKQDIAYVEQARLKPERTLLVTWIKSSNLLGSDQPNDTYFGPLPDYLSTDSHSVTVFGDIYLGLPIKSGRSRGSSPSPVVTAAPLISYWEIFQAFVRGLLSSVPVRRAIKSENSNVVGLVERDVHSNRDSIVYSLLVEAALRRLVRELRPTHIIHMCENNPWEKACSHAARSVSPEPQVTGYMHCAVILSHTKIIITEREKTIRPRPSKLICTGAGARDIMVRHGGHAPEEVVSGCALRHAYMADFQPRDRLKRPIRNVLVVLEGLPSMSHFLRFVYDALDGNDRFATVVRPHPAYRFDQIIYEAGISDSDIKTLRLSEHPHIMQDFQHADVVLYQGSTAAMEAGYLGIPLIHFDYPNILTDDPLFQTMDLKKVVAAPEELVPAIEEFDSLDHWHFLEQSRSLRQYISEYLTIPGPEHAGSFLRGSPQAAVHD